MMYASLSDVRHELCSMWNGLSLPSVVSLYMDLAGEVVYRKTRNLFIFLIVLTSAL